MPQNGTHSVRKGLKKGHEGVFQQAGSLPTARSTPDELCGEVLDSSIGALITMAASSVTYDDQVPLRWLHSAAHHGIERRIAEEAPSGVIVRWHHPEQCGLLGLVHA